ncbi:MAG TPA: hypothetical protein VHE53_05465 [Patescibacteria group bacterium]|nr:hypothetical protein [Patescibacteria group bacterium]
MPRTRKVKKTRKVKNIKGFVTLFLVLAVIILGILLSGFYAKFGPPKELTAPSGTSAGFCCDSGDGDACQPSTKSDQTFTFNGDQYGLLKSNITLKEVVVHLKDTGQTFNGDPIIQNTSDGFNPGYHGQACNGEALWGPNGECVVIPNDEIMYVCRKNCDSSYNSNPTLQQVCTIPNVSCYGNPTSVFDAYFRLNDYPSPGIPDVIKNCQQDNPNQVSVTPAPLQPTIVIDNFSDKKDLQLETFKLIYPTPQESTTNWLSPWCKPAIYLYPKQTTQVTVKVNSKEPLTYTDPIYPNNGWVATAKSNGDITYENKNYDYLYYETKISDNLLSKPKEGFVFAKTDLKLGLNELMPKLGLNNKETQQFVDYWTKALPDSPYYLVGITDRKTLDNAASLNITPKPDTIIRVGLYFETLKQTTTILPPVITTPKRNGFTVVEWGGIFKKHPGENFSCFM